MLIANVARGPAPVVFGFKLGAALAAAPSEDFFGEGLVDISDTRQSNQRMQRQLL
jgi:hypothetical protein